MWKSKQRRKNNQRVHGVLLSFSLRKLLGDVVGLLEKGLVASRNHLPQPPQTMFLFRSLQRSRLAFMSCKLEACNNGLSNRMWNSISCKPIGDQQFTHRVCELGGGCVSQKSYFSASLWTKKIKKELVYLVTGKTSKLFVEQWLRWLCSSKLSLL